MQDNDATIEAQAQRMPVTLKRKIDHQQQQPDADAVQFERIVFNLNKVKYNMCRERIEIIDQMIGSLRKRTQSARAYLSIRLLQQKRFIEIEEMRRLSSNNFEKSDDDKKACFKWSCEPSSSSSSSSSNNSSNNSIISSSSTTSPSSTDLINSGRRRIIDDNQTIIHVDSTESSIDHPNSKP